MDVVAWFFIGIIIMIAMLLVLSFICGLLYFKLLRITKPRTSLSFDKERMRKVLDASAGMGLEEKIFLLHSILGSHKILLSVDGTEISIEAVGRIPADSSNEGIDYSG